MLKPCLTRNCPILTEKTRCTTHQREWEKARRADPELTGRRSDTPQWRRARRAALRRDRHRCQKCGARRDRARPLHVHHINGVSGDDRLENLVTLCPACHRAFHAPTPGGRPRSQPGHKSTHTDF